MCLSKRYNFQFLYNYIDACHINTYSLSLHAIVSTAIFGKQIITFESQSTILFRSLIQGHCLFCFPESLHTQRRRDAGGQWCCWSCGLSCRTDCQDQRLQCCWYVKYITSCISGPEEVVRQVRQLPDQ